MYSSDAYDLTQDVPSFSGAPIPSISTPNNNIHINPQYMTMRAVPEVKLQGSDLCDQLSFDDKYGGFVFDSKTMQRVFRNKWVVFVGDSVMRGFYKDFIVFLQSDEILTSKQLKAKGEQSCAHDSNVYQSVKSNAVTYKEVRQYLTDTYRVEFYFTTRAYNEATESMLDTLEAEANEHDMKPDYVIMNSCLWDTTRYTRESSQEEVYVTHYMSNMVKTCQRLKDILPPSSMFIWLCTLPLASSIGSGFMTDEVKYKEHDLRQGIIECNYHMAQLIASYGFDVLDLHYYIRCMIQYREHDGVHWNAVACRHVTNLILAFIMDAIGETLPANTVQYLRHQVNADEHDEQTAFNLDHLKQFADWPGWTSGMREMFKHANDFKKYQQYKRNERQQKQEDKPGPAAVHHRYTT